MTAFIIVLLQGENSSLLGWVPSVAKAYMMYFPPALEGGAHVVSESASCCVCVRVCVCVRAHACASVRVRACVLGGDTCRERVNVHGQSMNHTALKKGGPTCFAKSPIAGCVLSANTRSTGVTGRWEQLSHAVRWLNFIHTTGTL